MAEKVVTWIDSENQTEVAISNVYREELIKAFSTVRLQHFSDWKAGEQSLKTFPGNLAVIYSFLRPESLEEDLSVEQASRIGINCTLNLVTRVHTLHPSLPIVMYGPFVKHVPYQMLFEERILGVEVVYAPLEQTLPFEFNQLVQKYLQ